MHDDLSDLPPELQATLDRARARFGDTAPPPAGRVLSAFQSVGLTKDKGDLPVTAASNANEPAATQAVGLPSWRTTLTQRRRHIVRALGAFIGTTLGKIVLGTTVAAAAVGAGQASGALDLNGDPEPAEQITATDRDPDDLDDDADETDDIEAEDVEGDEVDDVEAEEPESTELEGDDLAADDLDDQGEDLDDQGEDLDDQGEDVDDQGEDELDDAEDEAEDIESDDGDDSAEDDTTEVEADDETEAED